jgi:predicted ATPase/DNA-binding SARP family transcriptional activator
MALPSYEGGAKSGRVSGRTRKIPVVSLEFRILGPIEVREDGRVCALGGPKQRALLAALLVRRGEVVATERLIEDVWAGERAGAAARSVQVYVSELRKALGDPERIRSEAGGYRLEVAPGELDAESFERLLGEGRRLLASGEAPTALRRLDEALALWRGRPLPDVAYATFALGEISRLEELRVVALEERIDAKLELGRQADVLGELQTLVAEEPLRERPRRQLMLALYRSGRQADALAVYQDTRRALLDELGLEPSPELKELEAAILRQDVSLTVEPPELRARRHLPAPATPLIGRTTEVHDIVSLLRRQSPRLLTLTGAGGAGKTRLALEAAGEAVDAFPEGVFFVGLAPLADPQLVLSTIARTLDVQESAERPLLESLQQHLRDRRLLLVLDNFEHVDEAAPVVSELLAAASGLKALVTSRALLRLYGEHEYAVPPLTEEEAVALFATRARAVHAVFELEGTRPQVLELCRSLDCLPLGIELAAARTNELTLEEMLAMLSSRLELTTHGPRDVPARQQTLRATIEWSYGLLDESEQTLFARLAVFAGGWSVEAAQSVCDAELSELASLVEKSLVVETGQQDGDVRFGMLETIREFAAARLRDTPEAHEVDRRHAAYFLAFAEQADLALEAGGDTAKWLDRLEREHDNLRAVLDYAAHVRDRELGLRLAVMLGRFWEWRSHLREGLDRFEQALDDAGPAPARLRARALMRAGVFAHLIGEFARARERLEEALRLARSSGDDTVEANTLRNLGALAKDDGDHARAQAMHEEARLISAKSGDLMGVQSSLVNLSDAALAQHDYSRAEALAQEGVVMARELGHEIRELVALINLGLASLHRGHDEQARASFREVVRLSLALRYPECLVVGLEGLAGLDAEHGDPLRAARLMGAAECLLETSGYALESGEQELHERTLAAVRARLDRDEFKKAWSEGRSLSLEDAAADALESE